MEHFIESVQKYPCLWKVDSNEYKNNELKEAAWRQIIVESDITDVKEAKCMWKKLGDGHRQVLNKRKTSTGQAASSDNRLWKYEKQMEFLLPHLTNRRRDTNATAASATQDIIETTVDTLDGNRQTEEDSELATNNESQETTHYNTPRSKRKTDKLTEYFEQEQKRRIQRSNERDLVRKELLGQEKNVKPNEDTALKKFFDSMYAHTKDLPEYLEMRVQRKIFDTVMEAREEILKEQRKTSPQAQHFPRQSENKTYLVSVPYSSNLSGSSCLNADVRIVQSVPSTPPLRIQNEDSSTSTLLHTQFEQFENSSFNDPNLQCGFSPGTKAKSHENIRSFIVNQSNYTDY